LTSSTAAPDTGAEALRREALDAGDHVAEEFPNDPDAVYSKALIHRRFGNREVAIACWQRCVKLDPKFALAYYCLGWDAFDRGEFDQSVRLLKKALEQDAEIAHAYLLLARALVALGRMEEAIGPLEAHTRLTPRSSEGYFRLGQVHFLVKQYEKAKQYYWAALEVHPACTSAYYGLSMASARLGQPDAQRQHRQRFVELKAKDGRRRMRQRQERDDRAALLEGVAFAHTNVGKVYLAHGDTEEAEQHWCRAAEVDLRDTESREMLVSMYQSQQRPGEALPILRELSEIEPWNVTHFMNVGALSFQIRDFDSAEQAYLRVQELSPQRHEGYAALAEVYMKAGRNAAKAKELAQKALDLAPIADNYYLLGVAHARCGDREEALAALKRATELDGLNPDYRGAYAELKEEE